MEHTCLCLGGECGPSQQQQDWSLAGDVTRISVTRTVVDYTVIDNEGNLPFDHSHEPVESSRRVDTGPSFFHRVWAV